jgi:hypothetical protein
MKVFLGTEEIASVLFGLAEGFRSLGHETTTYVSQRNKLYYDDYDIEKGTPLNNLIEYTTKNYPPLLKRISSKIDRMITPHWLDLQTASLITHHDVFVFIWRPWRPEWSVFSRIKAAGKYIICVHLGTDVRDAEAFSQEFNVEDVRSWDDNYHGDLNERVKKLRHHELYADSIYSVPDQAGLAVRPYNHMHLPLSCRRRIEFFVPERDVPVIVHAPTNISIKGTDIILSTMHRLREEGYKFELKLLQNLPNPALLQELTNADILVDELVLHGPGMLGVEAMAAGCAVATKTLDSHKDIYNPPVYGIEPQTIYERLRALLENKKYRIELARSGFKFVREHNNPSVIADNMLKRLFDPQADYLPYFYIDRYNLPEGRSLSADNRCLTKQAILTTSHISEASVRSAVERGLCLPFSEEEYDVQFRTAGTSASHSKAVA